ncbi:MAG: ATP-dependent protease LonB, partial [Candidatus Thermoplasmatota archaeon]|nr:ATP-dependent protease LonB [Candidatus Thermoplasmatota archaeon]
MSDSNIDSSETEELSDEIDSPDEENSSDTTNWADSGNSGSEICTIPVEDWVENLSVGSNSFESTEDVPLPNRLVDQVIGQDAASIVVRKAAEQRRHVILMG